MSLIRPNTPLMKHIRQMYASETVLDPRVAYIADEEQKKRDENGIDFYANCLPRPHKCHALRASHPSGQSCPIAPPHEQSRVSMQELAEQVKADFGTIDILVHSLANGPEVKKRKEKK